MRRKRTTELLAALEQQQSDESDILTILQKEHDIQVELKIALLKHDENLTNRVREHSEKFLQSLQELLNTEEIDLREQNQQVLFELSYPSGPPEGP